VRLRLTALPEMHPCLLWNDILAAATAVLEEDVASRSYPVLLRIDEVPGYGSGEVRLEIIPAGVSRGDVAKVRRTYESLKWTPETGPRRPLCKRDLNDSCGRSELAVCGLLVVTATGLDSLGTPRWASGSRVLGVVAPGCRIGSTLPARCIDRPHVRNP
jgi:hypothetical protein